MTRRGRFMFRICRSARFLLALVIAGTAAEAQQMPPRIITEGIGQRTAPPMRLAERMRLQPVAVLGAATAEAPEALARLAEWNRQSSPTRDGFVRHLPDPRGIEVGLSG